MSECVCVSVCIVCECVLCVLSVCVYACVVCVCVCHGVCV